MEPTEVIAYAKANREKLEKLGMDAQAITATTEQFLAAEAREEEDRLKYDALAIAPLSKILQELVWDERLDRHTVASNLSIRKRVSELCGLLEVHPSIEFDNHWFLQAAERADVTLLTRLHTHTKGLTDREKVTAFAKYIQENGKEAAQGGLEKLYTLLELDKVSITDSSVLEAAFESTKGRIKDPPTQEAQQLVLKVLGYMDLENTPNWQGIYMATAIDNNQLALVQKGIEEFGCTPDMLLPGTSSPPISRAITAGPKDRLAIIRYLVPLGVDYVDARGRSAAYHAAEIGNFDSYKLILSGNPKKESIQQAFFKAISRDDSGLKLAAASIQAGADINQRDANGHLPLKRALRLLDNDKPGLLQLFLRHGVVLANPLSVPDDPNSPIKAIKPDTILSCLSEKSVELFISILELSRQPITQAELQQQEMETSLDLV